MMKLAQRLAQLYYNNLEVLYPDPIDQRLSDLSTLIHNRKELVEHMMWMCKEIMNSSECWHDTKAHRWIGFIQGALWALRVFHIDDLRRHVNEESKGL